MFDQMTGLARRRLGEIRLPVGKPRLLQRLCHIGLLCFRGKTRGLSLETGWASREMRHVVVTSLASGLLSGRFETHPKVKNSSLHPAHPFGVNPLCFGYKSHATPAAECKRRDSTPRILEFTVTTILPSC